MWRSGTKQIDQSFLKILAINNNGLYARMKQSTVDQELDHYFNILANPIMINIKIEYKNTNIIGLSNTEFPIIHTKTEDIIICGQFTTESDAKTETETEIDAVTSGVTCKYVIDICHK